MAHSKKGFTLIELLVVVGIIALLVGILVPALHIARVKAKEAAVKAMIHSIGMGLENFSNDFGSYPKSEAVNALDNTGANVEQGGGIRDTGAHRLVEGLAGIDLLGYTSSNNYYVDENTKKPVEPRKDLYVEIEKMNIVNPRVSVPDWTKLNITEAAVTNNENPFFTTAINNQRPRALLYYRAKRNENIIGEIYNYTDNALIANDVVKYPAFFHDNDNNYNTLPAGATQSFEQAIWNPKTGAVNSAQARPYNPKTFLLISAGNDGLYGTDDDLTNYGN